MASVKRERERREPARARPDRPDNLFGFMYEVVKGRNGESRRFIAMVCIPIATVCVGTALVIAVALIAAKGIKGFRPGVLPTGMLVEGSLMTYLSLMISKVLRLVMRRLRGSRSDAANDDKQSGRR
jgi:hypothetical protein